MDPGRVLAITECNHSVPPTVITGSLLAPPPCSGTSPPHPSAPAFPRTGAAPSPPTHVCLSTLLPEASTTKPLSAWSDVALAYKTEKLHNPPRLKCKGFSPCYPPSQSSLSMYEKWSEHSSKQCCVTWTLAQQMPCISQKPVLTASTYSVYWSENLSPSTAGEQASPLPTASPLSHTPKRVQLLWSRVSHTWF